MDVGHGANSGLGRLRGGDTRAAAQESCPPHAWALGDGAGEDVEIIKNRAAVDKPADKLQPVTDLSMSRLLYLFVHEGNLRPGDDPALGGPATSWGCCVRLYDER